MKMHNPPHPGAMIRELYLQPLDRTITAAAQGLGVTRKALPELVNARCDSARDMAIRLAKAFPHTDIRFWLSLQLQYDAGQAEQRVGAIKVRPFTAASSRVPACAGSERTVRRAGGADRWFLLQSRLSQQN